jgi:hypothetical protein
MIDSVEMEMSTWKRCDRSVLFLTAMLSSLTACFGNQSFRSITPDSGVAAPDSGFAPDATVPLSSRWLTKVGSPDFVEALSVAVDPADNVYISGRVPAFAAADFGGLLGGSACRSPLPTTGAQSFDLYAAAFDAKGDCLWVHRFGSGRPEPPDVPRDPDGDRLYKTVVDSDSNVYVLGQFRQTLKFSGQNGSMATQLEVPYPDKLNPFVASFDSDGSLRWAQSYTSSVAIEIHVEDMVLKSSSRFHQLKVLVRERHEGLNGHLKVLTVDTGTGMKQSELIVAKGQVGLRTGKILLDADNTYVASSLIALAGQTHDVAWIGDVPYSAVAHDVFISKYVGDAIRPEWTNIISGDGSESVYSTSVAENGDLLVAGTFSDKIRLAPNQDLAYVGTFQQRNAYLVSYDTDGELLWSKSFKLEDPWDTSGQDPFLPPSIRTYAAHYGPNNKIYFAGFYIYGTLSFGPDHKFEPPDRNQYGVTKGFLARLDSQGNHEYSVAIGTDGVTSVNAIAITNSSIYATGVYSREFYFDSNRIPVTAGNKFDVFLISFHP